MELPIFDDMDTVHGAYPCKSCVSTGEVSGGICNRCKGKGFHTQKDRKRNREYDETIFKLLEDEWYGRKGI